MVLVPPSSFIHSINYHDEKQSGPYMGVLMTKIFFLHLQNYFTFFKKENKFKAKKSTARD